MITDTILQDCGLSLKESQTYLALLKLGQSTINPIAKSAKIRRTSIYNFIDKLIELGFITRTIIRGRNYYQAVNPKFIYDKQKEKLDGLYEILPQLITLFSESNTKIKVSYFVGTTEVRNIIKEELNCKKLACYIWPGKEAMDIVGGSQFMNKIDRQRIAKKVAIQTIRFRNKDIAYRYGASGKAYLRTLRWAPSYLNSKVGLALYDTGKVGIFGANPEFFGIMIENQDVYDLLKVLYDLLWKDCVPARDGEGA